MRSFWRRNLQTVLPPSKKLGGGKNGSSLRRTIISGVIYSLEKMKGENHPTISPSHVEREIQVNTYLYRVGVYVPRGWPHELSARGSRANHAMWVQLRDLLVRGTSLFSLSHVGNVAFISDRHSVYNTYRRICNNTSAPAFAAMASKPGVVLRSDTCLVRTTTNTPFHTSSFIH